MANIVIPLARAHRFTVKEVGGKALPLSLLAANRITVPDGFVILSSALNDIKKSHGLDKKIHRYLIKLRDSKMDDVENISTNIRKLLEGIDMPHNIESAIQEAFQGLNTEYVAVRSSAACEDQKNYSWAGEFETYTVVNAHDLMRRIKQCWSSLYTPRALMYAYEQDLIFANDMAIIVQPMIDSDVSGVCFTKDPNDNDPNILIIEAIWGLGELLVHGDVTPDKYWVNKKDGIILDVEIHPQKELATSHRGKHRQKITKTAQMNQKLRGEEIMTVAQTAATIERIMRCPQDIEWSFSHNNLYILQARPITKTI